MYPSDGAMTLFLGPQRFTLLLTAIGRHLDTVRTRLDFADVCASKHPAPLPARLPLSLSRGYTDLLRLPPRCCASKVFFDCQLDPRVCHGQGGDDRAVGQVEARRGVCG